MYTANQYTVTFDYDGATSGNEQQTLTTTYDQPIGTLPTPTKEGCEFLGWKYNDETVTSKFVWTTDSDATFVAQWKRPAATEGLKYTLNSDGNSYSVSKGTATNPDILIPSTYNDKPVTSIGSNAFKYCSNLTSVTIPKSVTTIGSDAFYGCSKIASVNYLGTIESWCKIKGLYNLMLYGASSKTLGIDGKEIAGDLVIPNTVTKIPNSAFYGCSDLTSVTFEESSQCTSIVSSAFEGCSNLQYSEYDNTLYLGTADNPYLALIKASDTSITSCTININTKVIATSAFSGCHNLTSISIPNSVPSICDNAFYGCSSLTIYCEVSSKPSGWSSYWNGSYCPVVWNCNNNDKDSSGYAYAVIDGIRYRLRDNVATVIKQPRNITEAAISQKVTYKNAEYSVTSIDSSAFDGFSKLTSITIPNSVTRINASTFYNCSSLASVTIPKSVTTIGSDAFYGCSKLANINYLGTIESWCNIQRLEQLMYYSASGKTLSLNGVPVTELVIPSTVMSIPSCAFYNCANITSVTFEENSQCTSIGQNAFDKCENLKYNEYDNALYLGNIGNPYLVLIKAKDTLIISHSVNENTKVIADWAFDHCSSLTNVTIPNSITSVGYGAFGESNKLQWYEYNNARYLGNADNPYVVLLSVDQSITSFTINKNTKIIYLNAFYHCNSLTSITIPDSVADIGYSAFRDCSSLSSVTIGNSVTSIGNSAFSGCSSLTKVTIPDSVTSIDDSAFYNCSSLTSIILSSNVTSIDNNAFSGCNNLKTVYYNGTAEDWDKISVDFGNSTLTSATRYYYSENEPSLNADGTAYDGNYWHYVNNVVTVWKKEE